MKKILFFLLFAAAFMACSDDDNTPTPPPGKQVKIIVVNEGQMNSALGSLSVIYDDESSIYDIFRDINKRPIGDVAQSIAYINGNYFVPLNNSNKVEVVNPETFESVATIQGTAKACYIQAINETEAIVASLDRQLTKINTKTFEKIEDIDIPDNLNHMTAASNKLFGQAKGEIVVFDVNNITEAGMRKIEGIDNVIKTTSLIVDKNGMLWAYGSETDKVTLHQIDPATEKLVKSYEIPFVAEDAADFEVGSIINAAKASWGEDLNRMETDKTKSKLYFVLKTCKAKTWSGVQEQMVVFTFDVDSKEYAPYRTLPGLSIMYGMGISPDGDVYLCDCLDYTAQRGYLREYKEDGNVVSTYVGVYPTMVYFTEYNK